jgi:predicted esterase
MQRPLSQLIWARFQEIPGTRRILTLHRYNAFLDAMRAIGLAINPDGTVIGVQAAKGVYLGRDIVGYTWFVGPMQQPSPVHFGDGMQDLERFLWDEVDRQEADEAALPFLVGDEQGAIMALAMAGAVPDLLSGVVAINATFPTVPGWEPPLAPLEGLPVLLVNSAGGEALIATLESWGAAVTTIAGPNGEIPLDEIRAWIGSQPIRTTRDK